MKQALKIALGAVLLSATLVVAQSVWRGDMNLIDDPDGTSQYQVGGADIVKSMTFYLDSMGADVTAAVFTPPRAILVKQMDIYTSTAAATDSLTCNLRSTAVTFQASVLTSTSYISADLADVVYPASVACTLLVTDNSSGTGGFDAQITIWYTDE